jgi:hypothetical protein
MSQIRARCADGPLKNRCLDIDSNWYNVCISVMPSNNQRKVPETRNCLWHTYKVTCQTDAEGRQFLTHTNLETT